MWANGTKKCVWHASFFFCNTTGTIETEPKMEGRKHLCDITWLEEDGLQLLSFVELLSLVDRLFNVCVGSPNTTHSYEDVVIEEVSR